MVEYCSALVQDDLEEVSTQPHLFDITSTCLEDSIWSKMGFVTTICNLITLVDCLDLDLV